MAKPLGRRVRHIRADLRLVPSVPTCPRQVSQHVPALVNDHNKVAATFVSVGHQKIVEIGVPSRRFEQRYSGHDKSNVDASTTAYQENWLAADQSQNVMAGIGGNGGDGNKAEGGDVHYKASI